MMQAPDFGNREDHARFRRLDGPSVRGVLVEREVRPSAMIVREVRGQDAAQMPLAEHDHMVEALAAHGADEAFRKWILPGTARRRENFRDAHALDTMAERLAVDLVAIPEEIGWRRVVREGLHDLLGRPGRGGVLGDVEVDDPAAMVS